MLPRALASPQHADADAVDPGGSLLGPGTADPVVTLERFVAKLLEALAAKVCFSWGLGGRGLRMCPPPPAPTPVVIIKWWPVRGHATARGDARVRVQPCAGLGL